MRLSPGGIAAPAGYLGDNTLYNLPDLRVAQPRLGLPFKLRLRNLQQHGSNGSVAWSRQLAAIEFSSHEGQRGSLHGDDNGALGLPSRRAHSSESAVAALRMLHQHAQMWPRMVIWMARMMTSSLHVALDPRRRQHARSGA